MILLASNLIKVPVVSIQTGSVIAETVRPIIDPARLSIEAYEVNGSLVHYHPAFLRLSDVREISDQGMIIDSMDEIVSAGDIMKLDDIIALQFNLHNMHVIDEKRKKLGRVVDYTVDMGSFYIQQLSVKRPILHSFNDTELIIHRTQIIEINNDAIVVHSQAKAPEPERAQVIGSYVNPFRKQMEESPSPETISQEQS